MVYWVSYVDVGGQRVLLFTQDEKTASIARKNIETNKSSIDLILSLKGFGLSLVRRIQLYFEQLFFMYLCCTLEYFSRCSHGGTRLF